MKTEEEILEDIKFLKLEVDKKGKLKPNKEKIKDLVELIKVVKFSTKENVEFERNKIIKELDKKENMFEEFLKNFTQFHRGNDRDQRKDVRKIFVQEFDLKKLKDGLKNLNYLLNITQ